MSRVNQVLVVAVFLIGSTQVDNSNLIFTPKFGGISTREGDYSVQALNSGNCRSFSPW